MKKKRFGSSDKEKDFKWVFRAIYKKIEKTTDDADDEIKKF